MTKQCNALNLLGSYCGVRDIKELSINCLQEKYAIKQADIMVLFGGSIICGGDLLAKAIQNQIAKKYIIVGGAGHTTQTLRDMIHNEISSIKTTEKAEAEIFNEYIKVKYSVSADYLECKSTNCGNNITYLLDLIKKNNLCCKSIILSQDATMQRRMCAGFQKYCPDIQIINYATYQVNISYSGNKLIFTTPPAGMWDMERYISLLMGEIPRLTDNQEGYGPNGKDFISHVDIPPEVQSAFLTLKESYSELIRIANPAFASSYT